MNIFILAYHDDSDEVRLADVEAETWQEALKMAGMQWIFTNPAVQTFSQAQDEARENGYFINLKLLVDSELRTIL